MITKEVGLDLSTKKTSLMDNLATHLQVVDDRTSPETIALKRQIIALALGPLDDDAAENELNGKISLCKAAKDIGVSVRQIRTVRKLQSSMGKGLSMKFIAKLRRGATRKVDEDVIRKLIFKS
mmetsp:Transcript_28067/g.36267  ORF Transcript_28067/g.36267 Transcript_28067/m.36267 type:complete len:123 (-) Transcript_28067:26-394(-)